MALRAGGFGVEPLLGLLDATKGMAAGSLRFICDGSVHALEWQEMGAKNVKFFGCFFVVLDKLYIIAAKKSVTAWSS